MNLLDIQNLSTGYGRKTQLQGIELALPAGQSLAVIGINGAGKTTLLKCLLGLTAPMVGTVRIDGGDPRQTATRRSFAFLPERFAPSPLLTGFDIMRLTRRNYGLAFDRVAASAVAARLALPEVLLRQRLGTYSKGTVQKLGLAAALYAERPLLILDEPFSGLDPLARQALVAVLQDYRAGGGSLVFTSHLLAGLGSLCDQVAMLAGGRQVFNGSPAAFAALDPGHDPEQAFLRLTKSAA